MKDTGRASLFRALRRGAVQRVAAHSAIVRDAAENPGDAEDALDLAAALAEFGGVADAIRLDREKAFGNFWEEQKNQNAPALRENHNESTATTENR